MYKDIGIDCHFKYVCISGYLDDQDAVDFLIMVFPIMGLTLYLMVGLNGGTSKMRKRYKDIDERLLLLLPKNHKIQENYSIQSQKREIFLHIYREMPVTLYIRIQM